MKDRNGYKKTLQFTSRVHRQHNSLVITVPKGLCEQLEISAKDYILFEMYEGEAAAVVGKMALRGVDYDRGKRDSDRKDKGGRK